MYIAIKLQKRCKKANLGQYGRMREQFLREHSKGLFNYLVMNEEIIKHLVSVDKEAREQVDFLVKQLAKKENVDENLKRTNHILWMQMMNNIKSCAEEIILTELIYVWKKSIFFVMEYLNALKFTQRMEVKMNEYIWII